MFFAFDGFKFSSFKINRDPVGAQMQRMRSQIEQLQSELLLYRGDAGGAFEELQVRHYFRKFLKFIPHLLGIGF